MTESGSFVLDAAALRLRSDTNIDPLLTVQYNSVRAIVRDVVRLYCRHFRTFVAIYLLPVVPLTMGAFLLTKALLTNSAFDVARTTAAIQWVAVVLGFFASTFAFAAVAVAMSDVCSGNRPGIRRSYRRIFGRRFGVVIANTILFYLSILFILIVSVAAQNLWVFFPGLIVALVVLVRYMFVPVISAIEPRPGVARAFRRSAWLGLGYRSRAFATLLCIGDAGAVVAWLSYLAATYFLAPTGAMLDAIRALVEILVGLLVFPPLYIAAVLQYYDLRARKEGFRLTELPEDIV